MKGGFKWNTKEERHSPRISSSLKKKKNLNEKCSPQAVTGSLFKGSSYSIPYKVSWSISWSIRAHLTLSPLTSGCDSALSGAWQGRFGNGSSLARHRQCFGLEYKALRHPNPEVPLVLLTTGCWGWILPRTRQALWMGPCLQLILGLWVRLQTDHFGRRNLGECNHELQDSLNMRKPKCSGHHSTGQA